MPAVVRANGLGHAHATLYSTGSHSAFVIDAGASLASQGGIGGAIEALAQHVGPATILFDSEGTGGSVSVVMDGHAVSAADMQVGIRALGTINSYDFSGATVTAGGAITVAA
jgi:hypothetical protein|tara:strand:+ start:792 stop:1127 length:336 start_codon:yes stop_codon:yes gene_type:complete